MKKNKIFNLLFATLFLTYFNSSKAQTEESKLSDLPQTLDIPEAKTEVINDANSATEAIATEPVLEEAPVASKATNKNPNGVVLSEEDLLKSSTKKESSKISSKKINESEMFIQEADKYIINDNFKSLKLNDVIEQGLRKNYNQGLRDQNESLSNLVFEGVKSKFWYPSVKLTLSTDKQIISLLRKSSRAQGPNNPLTPTGYLGLDFGEYTIFNWGKDYALYLNKKMTHEREKTANLEAKRELRLQLIYDFFNLITVKNIEKIRLDQLRQASFLYRLNKEKITIGKISQQDYYQARNEYLRAQSEFHEAKIKTDSSDSEIAYTIADDVGTKYVFTEGLVFKRIKVSLTDVMSLVNAQNPNILNNKTTLSNAERSYDVAQKENLPLPKFSANLGAYKKSFGPSTNRTIYETQNGNGNVELVASINATWDITGEDGLFNNNKLVKSRMNKEIASYELYKNKHAAESAARELYKRILSYQNQILIAEARLPTAQKTFDLVLENYLNNKAKYNDFHLALIELNDTKILMETIKLAHLKDKIELAKLIGIEDFPGENFEHLAIKVKGK